MRDPEAERAGSAANILLAYQWRALNFCLTLFGNIPLGQHFVHITLMTVHARGWHPTVLELTAITGLARPSVSRHVSALLGAGLIEEEVDGSDRRRKLLKPTPLGGRQRAELIASLTRMNVRVAELLERRSGRPRVDSVQALIKMAGIVRASAGTSPGARPPGKARKRPQRAKRRRRPPG
jgi:DNA-binding MarR family transcriptional regulator